ncbi:MAG: glycine betaine ABC transporter substrate-binding protein [Sciscionella sp.]
MRRLVALLALLLIPLLVATGCGVGRAGSRVITIGTKEFTEEWVIGELYAQALKNQGYQVQVKNNIGSTNIIDRALTSGKIDVYPEYTGVILQVLAKSAHLPHTAAATFAAAKRYEETRGLTLLKPTPFQDSDAVAVPAGYAAKHHLENIGDLRRLGPIKYAEYPDNIDSSIGYTGLVKSYGLTNMKVVSLSLGLQYKALESGAVQAADVFTTDPELLRANLRLLNDTKNIFGFQNVAPVISQRTLGNQPPQFAATLNRIDALLTVKAIQTMNRAIAVNRLSASEVARTFLTDNHLL